MKKIALAIGTLIIATACNSNNQKNNDETTSADTTKNHASPDTFSTNQKLYHPTHEEDKRYAWYDTRSAGIWIDQTYLDRLVDIFKNDTTRSLYDYVSTLDQCNNALLIIEIEGCAKDKIFYLKNLGCNDRYISKSAFGIDDKTSFTLRDIYTGKEHHFESLEFNELTMDGKVFQECYSELPEINETLYGEYLLYDNRHRLLDTIKYQNHQIEKSDSLSEVYPLFLTYINDSEQRKPILPHSDLAAFRLYTGDSVEVELVDDAGDGMGIFETIPETKLFECDLKRTLQGFELHNMRDNQDHTLVKAGLIYKFNRIRAFESRRKRRR